MKQLSLKIIQTVPGKYINMHVTITVDGIIKEYQGGYDQLHSNDWEQIVRDMLDSAVYEQTK